MVHSWNALAAWLLAVLGASQYTAQAERSKTDACRTNSCTPPNPAIPLAHAHTSSCCGMAIKWSPIAVTYGRGYVLKVGKGAVAVPVSAPTALRHSGNDGSGASNKTTRARRTSNTVDYRIRCRRCQVSGVRQSVSNLC